MLRSYLKDAFHNFHMGPAAWREEAITGGRCNPMLARAIEHVVDEIDSRIRFLPHYDRRLQGPVEHVFRVVEDVVESIPSPLDCRRSAYTRDDTLRALFASPDHMQHVFSESSDVRMFFDQHPQQDDCWALLCMKKEERRQTGMALVDDQMMCDVLLTTISFTDHQLMSPGCSEDDARSALKSCIFDSLLLHARLEARSASSACLRDTTRLQSLRQRHLLLDKDDVQARRALEKEMRAIESTMAHPSAGLLTPADNLQRVVDILGNADRHVRHRLCQFHLNNVNVLLEPDQPGGHRFQLSEISIASQQPRFAVLACFPREELLPRPDFMRMADNFLSS